MGARGLEGSVLLARAADGLTLARLCIAVALVPVLGTGRFAEGSVLLGLGWMTDFLDGRAARASGLPTRLGACDYQVDTAVGAGIIAGFAFWGWVSPLVAIALIAVLWAGFMVTGNEALSQVLQATGCTLMLWRLWADGLRGHLLWLVVVIAFIAIANRDKLVHESLPTFFGGIAALFRRGPRRGIDSGE